jgi:ATP-dependent protease ClpP protease subunit
MDDKPTMAPLIPEPAQAAKRVVYFGFAGLIEPASVSKIAASINSAANNGEDVYLCLSSAGGLVQDGIYLYNHLRALPIQIAVHNTGTVASIAVALFCGAERRLCSKHGIFLIHPTSINSAGGRSAEQLKTGVVSALADDKRTEDILRDRTRMPNQLLRKRRVGDVWITPDVALKYGLIHRIEEFLLPPGQKIYQI